MQPGELINSGQLPDELPDEHTEDSSQIRRSKGQKEAEAPTALAPAGLLR